MFLLSCSISCFIINTHSMKWKKYISCSSMEGITGSLTISVRYLRLICQGVATGSVLVSISTLCVRPGARLKLPSFMRGPLLVTRFPGHAQTPDRTHSIAPVHSLFWKGANAQVAGPEPSGCQKRTVKIKDPENEVVQIVQIPENSYIDARSTYKLVR